ncbi:MAG TPA: hypothetical protein VF116_09700 [Ktedonobacterales bacterium]
MAAIICQPARIQDQQRRADMSAAPAGVPARSGRDVRWTPAGQRQRRHDAQQRPRLMARPSLPRLPLQA